MTTSVLAESLKNLAKALEGLPSTPESERACKWRILDFSMREHTAIWMRAAGLGDVWRKHLGQMPEIVDDASLAEVIGPKAVGDWPVVGEGDRPFDHAVRALMAAYEASGAQARLIARRPEAATYPVSVAALSGNGMTCDYLCFALGVGGEDDQISRASAYANIVAHIAASQLDDDMRERTARFAWSYVGMFFARLPLLTGPIVSSAPSLTQERVETYIQQLSAAYAAGTTPAIFARAFIGEHGTDAAAELLKRGGQTGPEKLQELLAMLGHVQTQESWAYVHEVWGEARKMLGMA